MNQFQSIIKMKCPKCRKGDIFTEPFLWSDPLKMPVECPNCGQYMEPEPGFYYGAMFLSYLFSGFALLAVSLTSVFYFKFSVFTAMSLVILVGLISYIKVLRLSRSLWIHLMVKYNPRPPDEVDIKNAFNKGPTVQK